MAFALAFILPMANYAKGLDFKDRPAFLRRIEEKLAALFSGIFVAKEQVKQSILRYFRNFRLMRTV